MRWTTDHISETERLISLSEAKSERSTNSKLNMSLQEITEPKRASPGKVSKRLANAIKLLEDGECRTQKAAAERAGINAAYLSEALTKPAVQAFIARKRAQNVQLASIRASRRLGELVDAESEHVAARMVDRILTTTGDLKSDSHGVSVNVQNNIVGYVLDLRGEDRPTVIEGTDVGRDERKPNT